MRHQPTRYILDCIGSKTLNFNFDYFFAKCVKFLLLWRNELFQQFRSLKDFGGSCSFENERKISSALQADRYVRIIFLNVGLQKIQLFLHLLQILSRRRWYFLIMLIATSLNEGMAIFFFQTVYSKPVP
jgi:hypothetical protein